MASSVARVTRSCRETFLELHARSRGELFSNRGEALGLLRQLIRQGQAVEECDVFRTADGRGLAAHLPIEELVRVEERFQGCGIFLGGECVGPLLEKLAKQGAVRSGIVQSGGGGAGHRTRGVGCLRCAPPAGRWRRRRRERTGVLRAAGTSAILPLINPR